MHYPLWNSLLYFLVAGFCLLLAVVLYRANPRRGINQSGTLFITLCGIWQFQTGMIYFAAESAGFYIRAVVTMHGLGVAANLTVLAALQYPAETFWRLVRRVKWVWLAAAWYVVPPWTPWFIPYQSTAEHPLRGVLWQPYGFLQILGGAVVLVATIRAAMTLRGASRFVAQILCGGNGALFVVMGARSVARAWIPVEWLVFSNAVVGVLIAGSMAYAILTRRVFRARGGLVGVLYQVAGAALSFLVAALVLEWGPGLGVGPGWVDLGAVVAALGLWVLFYEWRRRLKEREAIALGRRILDRFEEIWRRPNERSGEPGEVLDELLEWVGARRGSLLFQEGSWWRGGDLVLSVDDPLARHVERFRWCTAESIARSWRQLDAVAAGLSLERLGGVLAIVSTRQLARRPTMLVLGEKANGELYSYREIASLHALVGVLGSMVESRDAGRRGRALGRIEALELLGASIGHDFKQHLAAVRVLTYRLAQPDLVETTAEDYRFKLGTELDKLGEFSRRLTKLNRWAPSEREVVRLADVMEVVIGFLQANSDLHGVEIVTEVADPDAVVWADRSRLQQALINLGVNAIEAMTAQGGASEPGPRLEIRLARIEEEVVIVVADNGPGLPTKVRQRLFDPFVTEGKPQGDGLGLYLAWDAVTREGGIILHEANLPRGTRFVLRFPDGMTAQARQPTRTITKPDLIA